MIMKKKIAIVVLLLSLLMLVGCANTNVIKTQSTIVNKEIRDTNQYYFEVTYRIDGMEGLFEATIKVENKSIYDRYDIGDLYTFDRPKSK